MIDPALLEELRRFVALFKRPEYINDLTKAVPDQLVRQIAQDFRSYNPAPRGAGSTVTVVGSGKVQTAGENVPTAGNGSGWCDSPQIRDWKPPGLEHMDAMLDEADRRDRAARIREMAGTAHSLALAKAAAEAADKDREAEAKVQTEPKGKGPKA
jgi:hypothetical protein